MMISDVLFGKRLYELKAREMQLISQGEVVRQHIGAAFQPVAHYLSIADTVVQTGHKVANFVTAHPVIVGVTVAALFKFSPRRLLAFGIAGYSLAQKGRRWHSLAQTTARNISLFSRFLF